MSTDLRLRLDLEHPTPDEQARLDAIDRLLGMVELLGEDYVEGLFSDLDLFGIAQERRWFRNLLEMRRGAFMRQKGTLT